MGKYFTLNDKYSQLCYKLLFYFTIMVFHYGSKYILWEHIPNKKETINVFVFLISIIFFYLVVNPAKPVKVLQDNINNHHVTN